MVNEHVAGHVQTNCFFGVFLRPHTSSPRLVHRSHCACGAVFANRVEGVAHARDVPCFDDKVKRGQAVGNTFAALS